MSTVFFKGEHWSVVKLLYDNEEYEYDCVPNCWSKGEGLFAYPDKGKHTVTKMAKNSENPGEDWKLLPVEVIKDNYDNFERGMIDAVRFQRGSRSLTASETEERGTGCRKRKPLYRDSSNFSSDEENATALNFPTPPSNKKPVLSVNKKQPQYSKHSDSTNLNTSATSDASYNPDDHNRGHQGKCQISTKQHKCFREGQGQVTLETIANGLCQMSRTVHQVNSKIRDLKLFVESNFDILHQSCAVGPGLERTINVEDDDTIDLPIDIPIATMEDFHTFDKKLQDKDFSQKVIKVLIENAEVSSVSKTARSVLRQIMGVKLCTKFSLKGQHRKDQEEKKESFLSTNTSRLLRKCIERLWPKQLNIQKQVELTVATWLAQQGSTTKKNASLTEHNEAE